MTNPQILGHKIKSLRKNAAISQEALAKKLGLGRVAVSQIERGYRSVEFLELAKIAKIFSIQLDYFLYAGNSSKLYPKNSNKLRQFKSSSAKDILKEIGPISKMDYDYYENL